MTQEQLRQKEQRLFEIERLVEELSAEKALIESELISAEIGVDGNTIYDGELMKIVNKTTTKKEVDKKILSELVVNDRSLLKDLKKHISFTSPVTVIKILETEYPDYITDNPSIVVTKTSTKADVVRKSTAEIEVQTEEIDLF